MAHAVIPARGCERESGEEMTNQSETVEHPRRRVGALALIQDEDGRVLMTKRNYRPGEPRPWGIPGGSVDSNLDARVVCVEKVLQQTGLEVEIDALLCVHHMREEVHDGVVCPEGWNFLFSVTVVGGVLNSGEDGAHFVAEQEWAKYLAPYNVDRVRFGVSAAKWGGSVELLVGHSK